MADREIKTRFRLEGESEYRRAMKESADANFEVWDILTKQVGEGTVDYTVYNTYEKQVQYVREFITKRAAWIDRRLGTVS